MNIQAASSIYTKQSSTLTSNRPSNPLNQASSHNFILSATTASSTSAPTSTTQSAAAAAGAPPIQSFKSEKPATKRRRKATVTSQGSFENQDLPLIAPKRRKHIKTSSSSSSTPNIGYAPVPTPPLSTRTAPSSLSNAIDHQQNTPSLQNLTLNPSPRSYPNILSNQGAYPLILPFPSFLLTLPSF